MDQTTILPPASDRHFLVGLLALQMDFLSREALLTALKAWVKEKSQNLGQVLVDKGLLPKERLVLLDGLAQEHLKAHHGNLRRSLAAVPALATVHEDIRGWGDADLNGLLVLGEAESWATDATVRRPGSTQTREEATFLPAAPQVPAFPSRYRILRPHAKGGLGEVHVAEDLELHREVALKEMHESQAENPDSRGRFVLEAEITGALEHPGVVPVYGLGQSADGRPFYAMRLIHGETLDRAIEQFHQTDFSGNPRQRGLALRQLLGRLIAVCNVIAYAHSRAIVHRDLKPTNIMLGKYGETLVVDWGLAKPLDRAEPAAPGTDSLQPDAASQVTASRLGSVLGTPAFLSPEQAAGQLDEVGPASDIFSLGATLYAVLTGRAPYLGGDLEQMLRRAKGVDLVRPRQIRGDIPPALEAICLKAMAPRREDRYATPLDLAADVEHWLADEPVGAWPEPLAARLGRWARRHKPLVAAGVALLLTAVAGLTGTTLLIGLEQAQTEQARQLAVIHAAEAQWQQALAEERAGQLERQKKIADDHAAAEKRERQRAEQNAVEAQRQKKIADDLAVAEKQQRLRAEHNAAEAGRQKKIADDHAADAQRQKIEAERQRLFAEANFQKARDAVDQLLSEVAHRDLRDMPHMDLVRKKLLEKAIEFYQGFLQEKSKDPAVRREAGRAYLRMGIIYHTLGQEKQALEAWGEALGLFQKLKIDYPKEPGHQRDLATTLFHRGLLLRDAGRFDEALKDHLDARALHLQLVADHPANPEFLQDQASNLTAIAQVFLRRGKSKDAEEFHLQGLALHKKLAEDFPKRFDFRRALALDYNTLAVIVRRLNRPDEAKKHYHLALDLHEKLAQQFPKRPLYRQDVARTNLNLASLLREKEADEAKARFHKALQIFQQLADDFPDRPEHRQELGGTYNNFGLFLRDVKQPKEAAQSFQIGLTIRQQLVINFPQRADYHGDLGGILHNLALVTAELGEPAEARKLYEQAIQHQLVCLKSNGQNTTYRGFLRNHYNSLANLLLSLNEHAAAVQNANQLPKVFGKGFAEYHRAAGIIARAVPLAEKDDRLAPDKRKQQAEAYAVRAVQLLEQAMDRGFANLPPLASDPNFLPLRQRPDFQRLLEKLEKKIS